MEIGFLKGLEKLDLSENQLNGSIPSSIGHLEELEELHLNNNNLTGSIPKEVGNLVKLVSLNLGANQFFKPIPSAIGNLERLLYLNLSRNDLRSIPSTIGNLINLKTLDFSSNPFVCSIPSTIGNLVKLVYLDGSNNVRLFGSIPPSIGNLSELVFFSFSGNKGMSGPIPPEIGNLKNLVSLNLHNNGLSGSIPPEIGKLVNLEGLYLGWNQLSGTIPPEIGNLENLKSLSLRINNLTGELPLEFSNLGMRTGRHSIQINLQHNSGLLGRYRPKCRARVYLDNTGIILCGCVTSSTPASLYPPPGIPDSCLATEKTGPLMKRSITFSAVIGLFKFTCNVDELKNPFQDCLNTMAKLCNPSYMSSDPTRISVCKNTVDTMFSGMSDLWQNVRRECGQWPWNQYTGAASSLPCVTANAALQENGYYVTPVGKIYVTSSLTNSVNQGLWGATLLRG